jgi:hypothetical protein
MGFYEKQMEFVDNSNEINEVQTDSLLLNIIKDYLKKSSNEEINPSLINFINAK